MLKRIFPFLFTVSCLFTTSNQSSAQWIQTSGPVGGQVQSLFVSAANLFAGTVNGGVYLSTDNGASWTAVNTGLTNTSVKSFAVYGVSLYAGTVGNGVFLSTNNGTNWALFGMWNTRVSALAVAGTSFFVGTSGGVFRYWFSLPTWTPVNSGLTNTDVHALAVSGTNVFVGTEGGVFLSTNDGTSWTAVGLTNSIVNVLTVSPASGGSGTNIFAGTVGGGVFLSTNDGTSWTAVNTGLTNTTINAVAVSGTYLFAGTGGGVFLSTNNGTSWTAVNSGLTTTDIRALAVSGTNFFAGSWGSGVWRRQLSDIVTSVEMPSTDPARHFSLEQNYPNPFNPVTAISYRLSAVSIVKLMLYDVLGREVAMLVNEEKGPGSHTVTWYGGNAPSGIYYCRLQAGGYIETRKMVLLR